MVTDSQVVAIGNVLKDPKRPLKERFRALFTLKNLGGEVAIKSISEAFTDPSALLKHELAYCLGQMKDSRAIPMLVQVLEDKSQEPMVRHEAGEALGAIGDVSVVDILQKYSNDSVVEVAETCQLALSLIQYSSSKDSQTEIHLGADNFTSVDPAPASTDKCLEKLKATLFDEEASLFDRYRAMFSLRNINSAESAKVLGSALTIGSALFRHEIGYVLGQMECPEVVAHLASVVRDDKESGMVRHEAAEALGAIATPEAVQVLKEHAADPCRVVAESCIIALDMSDYANSKEFQYTAAIPAE